MYWEGTSYFEDEGYYTGVERIEGKFLYASYYDWSICYKGKFVMIGEKKAIDFLNSNTSSAKNVIKRIDVASTFIDFTLDGIEYLVNIYPLGLTENIVYNDNYNDFKNYFNSGANNLFKKVEKSWGGKLMYNDMNAPLRTIGKLNKIDDKCYQFQGIDINYQSEKEEDKNYFLSLMYNQKYCKP